jgi:hypothetical protein
MTTVVQRATLTLEARVLTPCDHGVARVLTPCGHGVARVLTPCGHGVVHEGGAQSETKAHHGETLRGWVCRVVLFVIRPIVVVCLFVCLTRVERSRPGRTWIVELTQHKQVEVTTRVSAVSVACQHTSISCE